MAVKIDVKELLGQAKKIEVRTTGKNWKKAVQYMKDSNKIQLEQKRSEIKAVAEADEEMSLEVLEQNDKNMGNMILMESQAVEYIADTLKLDEKQTEKVEDDNELDFILEFATKLAIRLAGVEEPEPSEKGGEKETLKA